MGPKAAKYIQSLERRYYPKGLVVGELGFCKSLVSSERVREARQYYMILISVDVGIPVSGLSHVCVPVPIVLVARIAVRVREQFPVVGAG
jgi:hypothetical protein